MDGFDNKEKTLGVEEYEKQIKKKGQRIGKKTKKLKKVGTYINSKRRNGRNPMQNPRNSGKMIKQ